MQNPFEQFIHPITKEDLESDEWEGQFSCQEKGCNGYALEAKYLKKHKVLTWKCQDGHISKLENVDE